MERQLDDVPMERLKEKKIHVTPPGIGSLLGKFHPFGIVWRHRPSLRRDEIPFE
jgi:hypothetical protein